MEPEKDTLKERSHLMLYSLLQLTCIVLSFTSVALPKWFSYCWFSFNIANAHNEKIPDWTWDESVISTYDGFCNVIDDHIVEHYCPGFCDSVEQFGKAGGTLAFFLLYSIILSLCTMSLHLFRFFRPGFKSLIAYIIVPIPSVPFILGLSLYFYLGNFFFIKTVKDSDECGDLNQMDLKIEEGLVVLLLAAALQVFLTLQAYFVTRKLFV